MVLARNAVPIVLLVMPTDALLVKMVTFKIHQNNALSVIQIIACNAQMLQPALNASILLL